MNTPSSPPFSAVLGCALAFLASASLTVVLLQASRKPSDAPAAAPLDPATPTSPSAPQPLLSPVPSAQPPNQAELQALQAQVSALEATLAQQQTALNQARSAAQAFQSEAQRMRQSAAQAQAELRQIQQYGQTLARCTEDTNELLDSIEIRRLRTLEWADIGVKTTDFVRSQVDQDGACRRSREIARRFLQAVPLNAP